MGIAIFESIGFTAEVEIINIDSTAENITTVEALFDKRVNISQIVESQNKAVFSSESEIFTVITQPDPFVIVVEKPVTITVVEDNEIRLFTANEDIPKNYAVGILDNGEIAIVRSTDILSFNRYIGINTADVTTGNEARVKISGTIFDANFTWDINKEIYLSETGELTQNPSVNAVYLQQIANVLTPTLILITHAEPVQY
jgi:hypothetical protein